MLIFVSYVQCYRVQPLDPVGICLNLTEPHKRAFYPVGLADPHESVLDSVKFVLCSRIRFL